MEKICQEGQETYKILLVKVKAKVKAKVKVKDKAKDKDKDKAKDKDKDKAKGKDNGKEEWEVKVKEEWEAKEIYKVKEEWELMELSNLMQLNLVIIPIIEEFITTLEINLDKISIITLRTLVRKVLTENLW